jgi:hypothetical protein
LVNKKGDVFNMLRIQVLGRGLIPRGHGIAPRMEPFPANVMLTGIILGTAGLEVNFIHPETNKPVPLTRVNYQAMHKKWENVAPGKKVVQEVEVQKVVEQKVAPVVQQTPPPVAPVEPVKEDVKVEAPAATVAEEEFTMKPIMSPDEKVSVSVTTQPTRQQQNNNQRR